MCVWIMILVQYGSSPGRILAIHMITISVGQEQRQLVMAYTAKRAQNANPPLGNHDIIKSFCRYNYSYISSLNCAVCTCTFHVRNRQESHHQRKLQVAQGLVQVTFVPLCNLQLRSCCFLLLLVTKMVLILCNVCWWCFFQSSTSAITLLALMVIIVCNLCW